MLQELYCRNYKAFGDSTRLPLSPLTVLVGPNNAGKSSVLDLVRLISTKLYSLNLSSGSGRLRTFDSILGDDESSTLTIGARTGSNAKLEMHLEDVPTIRLADDVSIESRFESFGKSYVLRQRNVSLHPRNAALNSRERVFSVSTDIGPLNQEQVEPGGPIDRELERLFGEDEGSTEAGEEDEVWIGMPWEEKDGYVRGQISERDFPRGEVTLSPSGPYTRYVGYEKKIDEPLIRLAFKIIEQLGDGPPVDLTIGPVTVGEGGKKRVNSESEVPSLHIKGVDYLFGALDFVPEWVPPQKEKLWKAVRDLVIVPLIEGIDKQLKFSAPAHLPSFRADPKRYYGPDDPLTALLRSYREPHPLTKDEVEKWLTTFEIGTDLRVEKVAPDLYAASVERNGERRYLADLGSGTAQLLPLILKLAAEEPSGILLLEEPEANLHPNHQARLADLIVKLMSEGHQVLVETHSEYLVRRLQYLVATKECEPQHASVLYIDALQDEADESPNVRDISIDEYGQLSEPFGSGFFDQATDLMVDLFEYGSEN